MPAVVKAQGCGYTAKNMLASNAAGFSCYLILRRLMYA